MSIKRLFDSQKKQLRPTKKASSDSIGSGVESSSHLEKVYKKKRRLLPGLDYLKPEEYVKFGSAEEYYSKAFEHIAGNYPYDGSAEEKLDFELNLNLLEKHIFDNIYPKTTGYITLGRNYGTKAASSPDTGYHSASEDYIRFYGGTAVGAIYDADLGRTTNLDFGGVSGSTVEFWLKKEAHESGTPLSSPNEVIFDVTNNQTGAAEARFRVEIFSGSHDSFKITCRSGSAGVTTASLDLANGGLITDNSWHHYAITAASGNSGLTFRLYRDGTCSTGEIVTGSNIDRCYGVLGRVGSLAASETVAVTAGHSGTETAIASASYGKLSASLDEIRYWKDVRTPQDIGRYWVSNVDGATNSSSLGSSLGLYFKFNEGIIGTTSKDKVILDYSGRAANGVWEGYDGESRFTGSAITEKSLGFSEPSTPIIYTDHSTYVSEKERYVTSGSQHDFNNYNSLMNSLPAWIVEEDEKKGNHLKQMTQIMASQLDTLHAQIGHMTKIKDRSYNTGDNSVYAYNEKLLESLGFSTTELFEDANLLTKVLNRSEDKLFDKDLSDIKNIIFRNIYNNLTHIYKAKGTERSFRNLLRCYGVDDNLFSINAYSDNTKYKLEDRYRPAASNKRYIDFSGLRRQADTAATLYQYYNSANSNSYGLITGSSQIEDYAFTIEANFIFPKKPDINSLDYYAIPTVLSSLFGFHTPIDESPTSTTMTWAGSSNDYGLQVYAKRVAEGFQDSDTIGTSKNVRFLVVDRSGDTICTSDLCENVYDNTKWNLALSIRPHGYPFAKEFDSYTVELYGSQYDLGIKKKSFETQGTLAYDTGRATLASAKRIYAGAHRTNFTGGLLTGTDIRLGGVRYWQTYLPKDTVDHHSRCVESFGPQHPARNEYLFPASASHHVPSVETLALNWDFQIVTGSDADGRFMVADYSSGSLGGEYQNNYTFSELDNILNRQHTGRGEFFKADDKPVRKEYVYTERRQLPEQVVSSDMTNILLEDDNAFTMDTRPVNYVFTVEKSMYDNISKRMLEFFGSVQEFNNLIGEPINRYRHEYKDLNKLREIFFRRVGNTPDLDKYVDYYRWLDTAVTDAITQLFPISAGVPDAARTMVESHILERSKYAYKYQNLKSRLPVIEGVAAATGRTHWRYGHAPIGDEERNQRRNTLWWKHRAERDQNALLEKGASDEDNFSEGVLHTRVMIHSSTLAQYNRDQRAVYSFKQADLEPMYGGGGNTQARRRLFSSNQDSYNQFELSENSQDAEDLFYKKKYKFIGTIDGETFFGKQVAPFSAHSSSVTNGYRQQLDDAGLAKIDITNLHEDSTGPDYDVPMQGPFTERHVGGLQFRHNQAGLGDKTLRKEGFFLAPSDGEINLFDPHTLNTDYEGVDNVEVPQGKYYREEYAKRPVNIRNIKSETNENIAGSVRVLGNYSKNYEVVQTSGREINNLDLRKNPSNYNITGEVGSYLLGLVEYPIPQRTTNKTVFTERFSAPGDLTVTTPATRDVATQQFSPNNALPYRNLVVRQPLQSLLQVPCGRLGYTGVIGEELLVSGSYTTEEMNAGSIGIPIASYHKTQRNTTHRLRINNDADGPNEWLTGSLSDNAYVTRPIPAADRISWFNRFISGPASTRRYQTWTQPTTPAGSQEHAEASPGEQGAHELYSHFVTSGSLLPENISLPSATGSVLGTVPAGPLDPRPVVPTVTISTAFDADDFGYTITGEGKIYYPWKDWHNFPIWKQTRVGSTNPAQSLIRSNKHRLYIRGDKNKYNSYYESPVSSKHSPMITSIGTRESSADDSQNRTPVNVSLIYSYGNDKESFSNQAMKDALVPHKPKVRPYDTIIKSRKDGVPGTLSGIEKILDHTYVEKIWPKENNVYLSGSRARQVFKVGYWKDSLTALQTSSYGTAADFENWGSSQGNYSKNEVASAFFSASLEWDVKLNRAATRLSRGGTNSQGYMPTFRSQLTYRPNDRDTTWMKNNQGVGEGTQTAFINGYYTMRGGPDDGEQISNGYRSIWPMDSFVYAEHLTTTPSMSNNALHFSQYYGGGELMSLRYRAGFAMTRDFSGGIVYPYENDSNVSSLSGVLNPCIMQWLVAGGDTADYREAFPKTCQYVYNVPTVERTFMGSAAWSTTSETTNVTASVVYYDSPGGSYTRPPWTAGDKRKFVDGENRGQLNTPSYPFFSSYDEYSEVMRLSAKDYTIIPEFRISEHVEKIYSERQEDFGAFNQSLLTLTGSHEDVNNSSINGFMTRYSTSDVQNYLNKFISDDFEINKVPTDFGMKAEVVKQFLPYEGLYPVLRTLEIAGLFSASYEEETIITLSTGSAMRQPEACNPSMDATEIAATDELAKNAGWQILLGPWFSPGILYNSIKSGIAVDHPTRVYNASSGPEDRWYHAISDAQWGTVFSDTLATASLEPRFPSPAEPLAGCLFTALTSGTVPPRREHSSTSVQSPGYHDTQGQKFYWPYRLPFEALLEPERHIGSGRGRELCQGDVNYYLKAPGVTGTLSTGSQGNSLYKMAMSNFLAAVPEFFLENGEMTKFVARPENTQIIPVSADNVYTMEVVLQKSNNFNMYSNPYAFGPPTATGSSGWDSLVKPSENGDEATRPEGSNWPLHRGEFAPFTPPHYYGTSVARLVYIPDETGNVTLADILNNLSVDFINEQSYKYDFHRELSQDYTEVGTPTYGWNRAWQNRMDLDASIIIDNMFPTGEGSRQAPSDQWVICPRWECPILDFPIDNSNTPYNHSSSVTPGNYRTLTQGMWHQYGVMPAAGEGVYLYLRDVGPNDTEVILSGSKPASGTDYLTGKEVRVNKIGSIGEDRNVVSLNSLVGFSEFGEDNKKRLGTLATHKTIKEALVAIPYVITNNGQIEFIEIGFSGGSPQGDAGFGPEIRKFRERFHQYNLPPSIERLLWKMAPGTYPANIPEDMVEETHRARVDGAAECIAMYLFEFETTLTRQDLADIWQGVLPDVARKTVFDVAAIDQALPLRDSNGQYDMQNIVDRIDERLRDMLHISRAIEYGGRAGSRIENVKAGFEPEIRWIFFKAKKRAPDSYYAMMSEHGLGYRARTERNDDGELIAIRAPAGYRDRAKTFNWPYDYFSLIEMGKVTTRTKFRPDTTRINRSGIDTSED